MAATSPGGHRARRARSASSRPTAFYFILAAIALLGVSGLAYVALRPGEPELTPPGELPANLAELGAPQPYRAGPADAPVEILEFADFECPSCAHYATVTGPDVRSRIVDAGRANLSYYDLPLPQHLHSYPASHAAACADEQGRFWEMHDSLYASQNRWRTGATRNPRDIFRTLARDLRLDLSQWEQCYDSRKYQRRIDANHAEAVRRGINSTPSFVVNDQVLRGAVSYDQLNRTVQTATTARTAGDTTK